MPPKYKKPYTPEQSHLKLQLSPRSNFISSFSSPNRHGTTEEAKKIVTTLNEVEVPSEDVVEVVVSPPFVFLPLVKSLLRSNFHVAGQNWCVRKDGTFTGEASAEMLVNLGFSYVILGHSDRRALLNESNEFVGDKVAYALGQGLKVIAELLLHQTPNNFTHYKLKRHLHSFSKRL